MGVAARRACGWLALGGALTGCVSRTATVALTFDDLPYQTVRGGLPRIADQEAQQDTSRRIVATLREAGVASAVFVNCGNLDGRALIDVWRSADAVIGNHTAHHLSAEGDPVTWVDDVRACDAWLRDVGVEATYFRYPYLRQGSTLERRDAAAAAITSFGYENAHVTAATSEWLLAAKYDAALDAGDIARAEAIAAFYPEHMVDAVRAAQALARERVGADVAHVTLLHVNRLNADHLDAVLAAFARERIRVVPLAKALADPVYDRPETWVGLSASFLWRIDPLAAPGAEPWFSAQEAVIEQAFPGP